MLTDSQSSRTARADMMQCPLAWSSSFVASYRMERRLQYPYLGQEPVKGILHMGKSHMTCALREVEWALCDAVICCFLQAALHGSLKDVSAYDGLLVFIQQVCLLSVLANGGDRPCTRARLFIADPVAASRTELLTLQISQADGIHLL